MKPDLSLTVARTSVAGCPACWEKRLHEASERRQYHPFSGHGFDRSQWSHPALDPDHLKKWAAAKAAGGHHDRIQWVKPDEKLTAAQHAQARAAGVEP